ncbi:MAG: AAA family ATPase [Magnetococcales bacterium]|nr:AAA family ATPase [Magnetococcales bacterium]
MIIRRLQSENLLCFKQLDLNDLPAQGPILISGPDESGKSSVLEILCLALFGRTATHSRDTLNRTIRWGAEQSNSSPRSKTAIA